MRRGRVTTTCGCATIASCGSAATTASRRAPEDIYNIILTPGERTDAVFTPADAPGTSNVLRWVPTERGYGSTFNRPSERAAAARDRRRCGRDAGADSDGAAGDRAARRHERGRAHAQTSRSRSRRRSRWASTACRIGTRSRSRSSSATPKSGASSTTRTLPTRFTCTATSSRCRTTHACSSGRTPSTCRRNRRSRVAVRFDDRPGVWMYHCHILDHAEVGMMGHLIVRDPNAPAPAALAPHLH